MRERVKLILLLLPENTLNLKERICRSLLSVFIDSLSRFNALGRGALFISLMGLLLVLTFNNVAGQNNDTKGRISEGLVAYYPFIEGSGSIVRDLSGIDSTLDLTIIGDSTSWLPGRNGIKMDSSAIVSSVGPASKIYKEIIKSQTFSIETWFKTSDLTQSGPARLVTLSKDGGERNVTLGQEVDSLFTRLRTTTTTLNGIPNMKSDPILTTNEVHVVVTYAAGKLTLFVDGKEVISEQRTGNLSNWDNTYPLAIGNEPTRNRSWRGEMYLVAIYNRALNPGEIRKNFNAGSIINSGNLSPGTPILVLPDNGSLFNASSSPKLEWQVPPDRNGDLLHFRIEISPDSSFNPVSIIESKTDVMGFSPTPPLPAGQDTASYSFAANLADGQYWWRVSAWDGLVYGPPSVPRSFIVDTTPPVGTLASSPGVSSSENFEVNWSPGSDVGTGLSGLYDVMVQTDNGPWTLWKSSISDTFAIYTGQHGHTYGFEAAAHDSAGNIELFSQVAETSTLVDTVTTDIVAPDPPLSLIANGSSPSPWQDSSLFKINWEPPVDRSGIAKALYKLGSSPTANFDTTGSVTNSSSIDLDVTQEDGQNFHLWFQDSTGNVDYRNHRTVLLRYDGTSPVINSLSINNAVFSQSWINQEQTSLAQVNVRYNEKHLSQLKLESSELNTSVSLEQIPSGTDISFNIGLSVQGKPDGLYELKVTLTDSAGNSSNSATSLGLDSTPPTGTETSSPDTSTSGTFVVTWTGSGSDSNGSGLSGKYDLRFQVDNGSWQTLATNLDTTSFTFQGQHGKTYGFEVAAYDNVGNRETFSAQAESMTAVDTGFVDIEAPTISHQPQTIVDDGQDLTIQANVVDNSGVTRVVLYYKQSGTETFQAMRMTPGTGNTYSATIPATEISIFGINYYIEAWDGINFSYVPQTNWDTMPLNISVRIAGANNSGLIKTTSQPGGEESTFYRMISIPLNLTNPNPLAVLEDDLGSYDNSSWRLFQYRASSGSYVEYPNVNPFTPGVVGWLIVRDPGKQIDSGVGTTMAGNSAFEITLEQGWNDFGIPFTYAVDWSDIQVISSGANDVMGPYTYQGQWLLPDQVTTLSPWEGYSVYTQSSGVRLSIPPTQSTNTQPVFALGKQSAQLEWSLGINATAGQIQETSAYLGVSTNALAEWDDSDYLKPPYIADYVSVHFPHYEWQGFNGNFTTDIRPPFSDAQVWNFQVETNIQNSMVVLEFTHLASLPKEFEVVLRDNSNLQEINIRQFNQYNFLPDQNTLKRKFDLIIGSAEYLDNADQIKDLQPETFALSQNFPNPFNAGTFFNYQIAKHSHVRIDVLNILGQRVRKLLSAEKTPGIYRMKWDGRGDNGLELGSGIYIIKLKAGSFQQTRKVILLR